MFRKIISASLSPNTTSADIRTAWRTIVTPWTWQNGSSLTRVSQWFEKTYGVREVHFFQSGRVALFEVFRALHIGNGDDVLVQAFTCVAVPNSVKWAGATPIYVDIDSFLNIDTQDAEKKITPRTKAIVVQHTFGIPADMDAIMAFAQKHALLVIEDCAHAIGATHNGKALGTCGDAAIFSFGRDKAVSSVWGGAAIINASCAVKAANSRLHKTASDMPQPAFGWILQQLLHPIAFSLILPTYTMGLGKVVLVLLQRMHLLSKPVAAAELCGGQPEGILTRYPNALARLLEVELQALPDMVDRRMQTARYYMKHVDPRYVRVPHKNGASYLRYPIFADDPLSCRKAARAKGILLGNWYHHVIDPQHTDVTAIAYTIGSCPKAEYAAEHILNLPTLITEKEAAAVESVLRYYIGIPRKKSVPGR